MPNDEATNHAEMAEVLARQALRHCHLCFVIPDHVSAGFGFNCGVGARSFLITTVMPLRNLKTPALTTVWPASKPLVMEMKSPRASPTRTKTCLNTCDSLPVFSSFFFSIT